MAILLAGCGPKAPLALSPQDNQNVLTAIKQDKVQPVMAYFDKGMNPNSADETGTPFLVTAAKSGTTDLVYTFLRNNALVDIADANGVTPLMAACAAGNGDIVTLLLDRKADVSAAVKSGPEMGRTPLMYAAQGGNVDIVLRLLKTGVKPNVQDAQGRTALMYAVENGQMSIVDALLIPRGNTGLDTDVNLTNRDGKTALSLAEAKHNDALVTRLKAAGAKIVPKHENPI